MRVIQLEAVPNQSFSVTIDGNRWVMQIKDVNGATSVDISLNEQYILLGQRVVAGTPIIPYRYLQGFGNFILLTENEELVNWQLFGSGQVLVYATAAEIENIPKTPAPQNVLQGFESFTNPSALRVTTQGNLRETTQGNLRTTGDA